MCSQIENIEIRNPVLSVIVPVFNSEQYLEECLDSIIKQTYCDMEIIIVDDGSTDGSLKICNAYSHLDHRIRVISKENGGLIRARKTGLSAALGKIIGFVDSDDWIEPQMYEELIRYMIETGCDMVSSGIIRDWQDSGESKGLLDHYNEGLHKDLESEIYPTMLFDEQYDDMGLYCNLVNKVFKKSILDEIYEDINEDVFYGEDALTCYPYCLQCDSIYILHKAFYHYNIRNGSMCSQSDERLPQNNYLLYVGLRDAFRKSESYFPLMRQLKRYVIRLEKHCLLRLYRINPAVLDVWKFLYPDNLFQKKLVIYGAGACGQALYRMVCEKGNEKNIACWVDKQADERTEECAYPIRYPNVLLRTDWEVILIAVENESLARQIADEIRVVYGIEEGVYWSKVEHISN